MRNHIELKCHGRKVTGALGLLSCNENGLTFALGYVISRHHGFGQALLRRLGIRLTQFTSLNLQRRSDGEDFEGITDIEIEGASFYLIIEAKKEGWPTIPQLQMYADRLIKKPQKQLILCALGVPPDFCSPVRDHQTENDIKLVHLRWHDVLGLIREFGDKNALLAEFAEKIEEVIAMQSYDSEVSVRDITWGDPTRELYYDNLLYNAGPRGNLEPLFFAPSFTKNAPVGMDGIQFISRVYYRDMFNVNDRIAAQAALSRAKEMIEDRVSKLKKRKTTTESVAYLQSLYSKWEHGIKTMPRIWPADNEAVIIYFLGKPMRLPIPLPKEGGMIAPGFSLTLEELLNVDKKTFKC